MEFGQIRPRIVRFLDKSYDSWRPERLLILKNAPHPLENHPVIGIHASRSLQPRAIFGFEVEDDAVILHENVEIRSSDAQTLRHIRHQANVPCIIKLLEIMLQHGELLLCQLLTHCQAGTCSGQGRVQEDGKSPVWLKGLADLMQRNIPQEGKNGSPHQKNRQGQDSGPTAHASGSRKMIHSLLHELMNIMAHSVVLVHQGVRVREGGCGQSESTPSLFLR